jgi:hypothetical protein
MTNRSTTSTHTALPHGSVRSYLYAFCVTDELANAENSDAIRASHQLPNNDCSAAVT